MMRHPLPFRLNRNGLLLALISAAFAGEAGAAAARVDFSVGQVTVTGADGRPRAIAKGVELDNGDTVRTTDGRAQLRFTDGAYVSLQPNTEFGISDYRFEGRTDGSERGFFSLVKGAMRTVTGAIGRVNRPNYKVTTPTATVGIRGTGGLIQIQPDGSTLVNGTSGIWSLTNPVGTIDIPAGTSGLAPSAPNTPPQTTSEAPSAGPAPATTSQQTFTQGDETTSDGKSESATT
ncbi:MAG: FecR family protein, partial [Burkholderiales bacterium]